MVESTCEADREGAAWDMLRLREEGRVCVGEEERGGVAAAHYVDAVWRGGGAGGGDGLELRALVGRGLEVAVGGRGAHRCGAGVRRQ